MNKLAFCFLTYDGLSRPDIWKQFFNGQDYGSKYNVYAHNKIIGDGDGGDGITSDHQIQDRTDTYWSDVTIVIAIIYLLKAAYLGDVDNEHFIILSGNCIPIRNFQYIYDFLGGQTGVSFFNKMCSGMETNFSKWKIKQLNKFNGNKLNSNNFDKVETWCILSRKHVKVILSNFLSFVKPFLYYDYHIRSVKDRNNGDYVVTPEEIFFVSLLKQKLNGYEFKRDVKILDGKYRTTYIVWLKKGDPHPKTFKNISENEISKIAGDTHALFMRKVT